MTMTEPASRPTTRPYSPASRASSPARPRSATSTASAGRLLYRGYRIGDLVEHGTLPGGRQPAVDRRVGPRASAADRPDPRAVMTVLRALPPTTKPMDALRTAVSAWGADAGPAWPPTVEQARALTAFSPSALAAFARLRAGPRADRARPALDLVEGFLYQLNGDAAGRRHGPGARRLLHRRRRARLQRLDVHGPGHHLDPVATSRRRSPARSAR